jgi:hypothetical protein
VKNQVWRAVPKKDFPKHSRILYFTWAMKKKSNVTYGARLNTRGSERIDGNHYDSRNIS